MKQLFKMTKMLNTQFNKNQKKDMKAIPECASDGILCDQVNRTAMPQYNHTPYLSTHEISSLLEN